ncbi:MAG TPA: sugar phosphate isomerase/epimerase [Chitinophagaceae bacterium]|nr:sugar phosphate isomerase/epimerase [Chitinophagaceae bacterium]
MQSRRHFLKQTSLLSAGALISPALLGHSDLFDKKKIGLQLYTVRDAMQKDPAGTLAKVAQIGYNEVEGATYSGTELYYGMDVKTFSGVLKTNGLNMPSSHYALGDGPNPAKGTILNDWNKAVDDAAAMGQSYMVCAWLPEDVRKNLDGYRKVAEQLNKAGETCKKSGIQLCYHNHNFEFPEMDGKVPYEVLLSSTDRNLVKMEMDMYWIVKAGFNPIKMFKEHPGRFVLWHIKDMDNTPRKFFTEVGSGIIDFKKIFAHAREAGMKYFFVEQDICPGSPFVSIAKSIAYLKSHILNS